MNIKTKSIISLIVIRLFWAILGFVFGLIASVVTLGMNSSSTLSEAIHVGIIIGIILAILSFIFGGKIVDVITRF